MIQKYRFGSPMDTEAVVEKIEVTELPMKFFEIHQNNCTFTYHMDARDIVYGLGENVRGINKRGFSYTSKCVDEGRHTEDKNSLYAAHNFFIVDGTELFGVFVDCPGIITFDIGETHMDRLAILSECEDFDLYLIEGADIMDIILQFRKMVGPSYIPPKWSFGYQQSRYSYMNSDEVREVAQIHRNNHIPLDAIYLDIDYMERFKDFTINRDTFSDFELLVKELKEDNIRLIPIIDAGVKIEEGYDVYEEGVANNYFCKNDKGEDFVAGVWPGKVHFPDVLNKEARAWFGQKYDYLISKGIEGFWNDMNEPSIFYSEEGLKDAFDFVDEIRDTNIDIYSFFELQARISGISNNRKDYKRFYHNVDGTMIRHDKVHNLFGYNMTRAASEAFDKIEPDKRLLLFSRSSYIGMHRYGGIWTGDNRSWWGHLLLNIKMMPSLNMCGFLYTGADLGGFGNDTTEDLLLRWLEFGIFAPLMRNHTECNSRGQEVYKFSDTDSFRNVLGIRYGILPYIYSEYMKAALKSEMYFKPLRFVYTEDEFTTQVEDQLLVGDGLMIAPVYEQNARGRYVYLPEAMLYVKMRSLTDCEYKVMEPGHHYIEVELNEVPMFIRKNHIIPFSQGGQSVADINSDELKLVGYVTEEAVYELYDDDGMAKEYDLKKNTRVINVKKEVEGQFAITSTDSSESFVQYLQKHCVLFS